MGVMAEIQLGKVREAASLAGKASRSIQSVLHRLVMLLAEEPGRSPSLARALISSFLASEGVRTIIDRNMREGRKAIAEIVAAGQERGEIDRKLKKNKIAIQFQQMLMGTVLLWSLHGKPALDAWVEDSFQHLWRAIAASNQESKP